MAWIESHQSLSRHRKTLRVVALLKVDRHKLIGHLHELWWWALDNADIYGLLPECTYGEIAEAAGWPVKDADRFVEALLVAGFIDRDEMQRVELSLHDWYEFAGKLNQKRAENRERMQRARAANSAPHVHNTNGARAPATVPNQPDRTGPTEPDQPEAAAGSAREKPPTKEELIAIGLRRNHAAS